MTRRSQRQQALNFLPLPQGQRSLRPGLSWPSVGITNEGTSSGLAHARIQTVLPGNPSRHRCGVRPENGPPPDRRLRNCRRRSAKPIPVTAPNSVDPAGCWRSRLPADNQPVQKRTRCILNASVPQGRWLARPHAMAGNTVGRPGRTRTGTDRRRWSQCFSLSFPLLHHGLKRAILTVSTRNPLCYEGTLLTTR